MFSRTIWVLVIHLLIAPIIFGGEEYATLYLESKYEGWIEINPDFVYHKRGDGYEDFSQPIGVYAKKLKFFITKGTVVIKWCSELNEPRKTLTLKVTGDKKIKIVGGFFKEDKLVDEGGKPADADQYVLHAEHQKELDRRKSVEQQEQAVVQKEQQRMDAIGSYSIAEINQENQRHPRMLNRSIYGYSLGECRKSLLKRVKDRQDIDFERLMRDNNVSMPSLNDNNRSTNGVSIEFVNDKISTVTAYLKNFDFDDLRRALIQKYGAETDHTINYEEDFRGDPHVVQRSIFIRESDGKSIKITLNSWTRTLSYRYEDAYVQQTNLQDL